MILPRRRVLAAAVALAASCLGPQVMAHAHKARPAQAFSVCPLGAFTCAPRPVSYAMCKRNDLLEFYQSGLPEDEMGRPTATTHVAAVHADSSNPRVYKLDGRVRLRRYDQLLRADHATYNDNSTAYDALGHVRYQDSTLLMSANHIHGTTQPDHAVADHVRYQLLKARGNGRASRATLVDPQHEDFTQATYSTCDPSDRVWEFKGKSVQLNKVSGIGTLHSGTMRYRGVPFLYLPYFTFPISDKRKSGFLEPTVGRSTNNGFSIALPYYLNLAPNYDATITPTEYTERGLMLGGEFRYLIHSSRGKLDVQYLPDDRNAGIDSGGQPRPGLADGTDRYHIQYGDSTRLSQTWNFHTSINHVSDKYFLRDFGNGAYRSAVSSLASNAYVSGGGNWWSASFGAERFESVDPAVTAAGLQYNRLPRTTFNIDTTVLPGLYLDMPNEAVAFRKTSADVIEGDRVDLYPTLSMPFDGAAWFVHPTLGYRYTAYQLSDDYQRYGFHERTPSRALPIASIDSGLIFERDTHLFGSDYTQTLEPRLYYLYVPYRNQSNLPLFDTRHMTFDYWQLFTTNRFSGADRQQDANDLTAAVTSRLLDDEGVERASISFGQIHYFRPQRVQLSGPPTDYSGSAYVTQLDLKLSDRWQLTSDYQWDPHSRHNQVATVGVQSRIAGDGVFNFSYRYRDNFLEQFDVSAVYPVSTHWRLVGRWNVALRDYHQPGFHRGHPKTLEALAGIEYDSCCVAIQLVGHHYVNDNYGDTANAIMLNIRFKGLGSTSPQTGVLLRRAILGYQ